MICIGEFANTNVVFNSWFKDEHINPLAFDIDFTRLDEQGFSKEDVKSEGSLKAKFDELGLDMKSYRTRYYQTTCWGTVYRFVNPKLLSDESIQTLMKEPNVFKLDGDLSGRLVEISKDKICIKPYLEL